MSKKLKIIILIVVAVLVLAVVGIFILINSNGYKEKLITSELRTMTEEFYSYYYEDQNAESKAKDFVAQFKDSGLSVSLKDMKIFLEGRTGKEYNSKRLEKCDIEKTISIMYPEKPFGKKDVSFKFNLSCK